MPKTLAIIASKLDTNTNDGTTVNNAAIDELRTRLLSEDPKTATYDADPVKAYPILQQAMSDKLGKVQSGPPLTYGGELDETATKLHRTDPSTGKWSSNDAGARYPFTSDDHPVTEGLYLTIQYAD